MVSPLRAFQFFNIVTNAEINIFVYASLYICSGISYDRFLAVELLIRMIEKLNFL